MATVVSLEDIQIGGTETLSIVSVAFDSSYPAGGEALDLAANRNIKVLLLQPTAGYVFEWIPSTQLIKVYRQKDPANAGGADIPLPEVGDTANLSALTAVQGIAIGS